MCSPSHRRLCALLFVIGVLGCEPQAELGARTRTEPTLVDAASCDALADTLVAALAEEFDTRVIMGARQQAVGGYSDDSGLFTIDDELPFTEGAFGIDPPRALGRAATHLRMAPAPDLLAGAYVGFVAGALALFTVDDGVPTVRASLPIDGTAVAFARVDADFVVLSAIDPFSLSSSHPLAPFTRADKSGTPDDRAQTVFAVAFTRVTRASLVDGAFVIGESLFVEGDALGLVQVGTRAVAVTRFAATSPDLRAWPQADSESAIGVFGTGRAVADSRAHNAAILSTLTLDDVVPRVVDVDATGVAAPRDFPCTRTLAADDMPGRTIAVLTSIDLDGSRADDALVVDALRTSHPTFTASDDALFVVENMAPLWWYWETDALAFATNVHRFDVSGSGLAPARSTRLDGILAAGNAAFTDDAGALLVATRDSVFTLSPGVARALSHLSRVDAAGDLTSVTGGMPSDAPPLGLHAVFDRVLVDTGIANDDAIAFDAATLSGGFPVPLVGRVSRVAALDDTTAFAMVAALDDFGFESGLTRIIELTSATLSAPRTVLTLGTARPTQSDGEAIPGETPVAVPVSPFTDESLFTVSEDVLLVPRFHSSGGTALAVVARRRDLGLSLIGQVADTFGGAIDPSRIERAAIDDGHLVTIGSGGIVVRALADLSETGRVVGSTPID